VLGLLGRWVRRPGAEEGGDVATPLLDAQHPTSHGKIAVLHDLTIGASRNGWPSTARQDHAVRSRR
jgi:hypothetical protein